MPVFLLVGEDQLCCELGRAILQQVCPGSSISSEIVTGGFGKLKEKIPSLNKLAPHMPVLMIADGDQNPCVVAQRNSWLPDDPHENLLLRLAVREAEAWVLADHAAWSEFAEVSAAKIPPSPDELQDPKQSLLGLVTKCKKRILREEMLPSKSSSAKIGLGYNIHMATFVRTAWSALRAAERSSSLRRAIASLERFK
ncbi:DUF4276 family protein [Pseudomonas sp. MH2]|uniref:DUF4276 family protein n=1 Tax=Pseudomonas machongensis TaxID=3110229 RepID=A0ABU5VGP3_9PSED|nr:hypothetical protein [Pseudomonas sp. MH2]MEA5672531.1 DUF4276 family protein [Pseudomonas sp. MH2]